MRFTALLSVPLLASACVADTSTTDDELGIEHGSEDPPDARVLHTHGAKPGGGGGGSPDLLYHGGPVMASGATVQPIFWGSSWSSDPQNKKGWINSFYQGMGGSRYA